ncbi:T9SS type A sorting domain-containing protein [Flavobacterium urocaniciphilum]|uniref:Por secretion system C-terminal sorting domain-containing protein n=1 Tax=Flavobacterium urocaniciphilum TaxID=1299341 RepID=A0A1H9AXB5_9FLAO|nr:T9SS type A sorting domain-containing protein [Flavobacterium urocaniciphilum]SEP81400.1 Por secretion system C-terminal sorting domain-containing protein [Flavobacterium urocaniciphilum]
MKKLYFNFEKTKYTNKVYLFFLMLFCLFVNSSYSQIGVTVTNNTNTTPNLAASYTSLANALTDLNAVTAMSGPVTLTLAAGNETAPPTGLILGSASLNAVLSATNTVTITGTGATTILNAGIGTATPASTVPDGIFKLVGADYVTLNAITFTDSNTTNPASMEVGLGMFKLSATDGCQNNTIQNCIFNMQRVNNANATAPMVEGSVGIALMNSTAIASTTALTVTAASGASSNNKFYGNTINGGNYGIVLRGFTAVSPFTLADTNNDVGGASLATGNTILNFGGAAAAANPSAGIRIVDQWGANISYNNINNNNGSGVNHVSTLRGIVTSGGTSASININNNTVSIQSGATTSQLDGINNGIGSTAASNTVNINNNTVLLGYPNVAAAGNTINGIINSGSASVVNVNSNSVSQISGVNLYGTGSWVMIEGGSPGGTLSTSNNIVSNIVRAGASGNIRGVKATTPTGMWTCTGNLVENISYSLATSTGNIDGIYDLSSATLTNIYSNIVRNLSTPTTGIIQGVRVNTTAGTHSCSNNQVYNFSTTAGGAGGGTFTGISYGVGVTSIFGNTIYNLNSTGTTGGTVGTITGLSQTGGTTSSMYNNKVYNLSSTSTGATIIGINSSVVTTSSIYNNLIGDLFAPAANVVNAIRGIDVSSTNANVYHNTVNINATSTGTNFGSSALNASATTNLDLKNNIFLNASVANGTGLTTAYRRSTTVLTAYSTASNNNLFYAGTPSATNLIFNDGTNSDQTLAAFKARVTPRESSSISENPTFVSTTGSNSTYLHINTVTPTGIESGGMAIGSVTTDFDNDIRQGNVGYVGTGLAPDMGADEFEGVSTTPVCSGTPALANTLTSNNNFCVGNSTILSLDVNYTTLGISYQWESSMDNISYSPIGSANLSSYTASPIFSTWYRCVVSCSASGLSMTSTPVQVNINMATFATIPLTESFESTWITSCVTAPLGEDVPNNSWRMIKGVDADASWRADNTTTTLSGWLSVNGAYTPISQNGARSARFHSYNVSPAGDKGSLDLYVNLSPAGTKELSFYYITPNTGIDQLELFLSTDGGATFNPLATTPALAAPTTAVTTWTNVKANLATNSATCVIRFRATGDNGSFDIGLDNVSITLICSGAQSITTSPNVSICNGDSTVLSVSSANDPNHSYVWSPATGLSATTGSSVTANPTTTTTYTVTATDLIGGCVTTGSIVVTVNPAPTAVTVTPANAPICTGSIQQLTATGGKYIITSLSGTGASTSVGNTTGSTLGPNPLQNYYGGNKQQWIYTAAELSALGLVSGTQINSIKLELVNANTTVALSNLVVKMKNTTTGSFASTTAWETGLTTVKAAGSYTPVVGLNTFTFDVPFTWDGTSNLVIEMNYSNNNTGAGSNYNTAKYSPTAFVSTIFYRNDTQTAAVIDAFVGAANYTYSSRNDVTFGYYVNAPVTWSPITDLYTDAAATIAYTGTATNMVYTKPTAGITYTATATLGGCTKSNTSVVSLVPNTSNSTTASACDSYTWSVNGATYTSSGTYTNVVGCHTETLNLTITPSTSNSTTASACDSYTWSVNGATYTTSGTYTNVVGCHTETLNLTITPSTSNSTTASACDSYTWSVNGANYTSSGTYTNVVGCHTETLNLTITPSTSNSTTASACDSYTWSVNGATYTSSGTYTNVVGCHTETLNLTITPSTSNATTASACDSYTWSVNGATYTSSGTYTNVVGCHTETLNLTITPSTSNATTASACDSYTWSVNGATYTSSGTYTNVVGCHTETLNLTITPSTSNSTTATACDSYTWSVNGATYTSSGTYTNVVGCHTETLNLTITPSTSNATTISACDSYTWSVNGATYTSSGTYTNVSGCHTETLNLTITVATISGSSTQVINGGIATDVTIEDIVVTSNGTVTWYASASDAAANINPLPAGTVLNNGDIYYGVTNIGSCRSTVLAVTVTVVLGTESFDLNELNYYPNPVQEMFNIKYNRNITDIQIFDLSGRMVKSLQPNTDMVEINLRELSSAMYIVKLKSEDNKQTEIKIVKK